MKKSGKITGIRLYFWDIGKETQTRDELRRSEERLKILFDYAPDAYYLIDTKGNFVDGNKEAEKISGYKKKELIGKNFLKLKLLSPGQNPKATTALLKNVAGKATGPDEFILVRKDGDHIPVEIRTYPVRIRDQMFVLGIARDITRRKQAREELIKYRDHLEKLVRERTSELEREIKERRNAEDAIRESEEKFRLIFELSSIGKTLTTPEGILSKVNRSFCDLLGYNSKELEVKSFAEITHPDDLDISKECVRCLLAGEQETFRFEKRYIRKDGQTIRTDVNTILIRDAKGKPVHFVTDIADITKRKKTEMDLRESENRFRTLIGNIPGAVYRCDMDSNWTMHYLSDAIENICGYPVSDFIDNSKRSYNSIIHPDDQGKVAEAVQKSLANDKKFEIEYRILHKNGNIVWVYERGQIIVNTEGAVDFLDGIIIDITGRKKILEELKKDKKDADAANRAKSEFLANVSHEIRTPMNAVLGYAELLIPLVSGKIQKNYLQAIKLNGASLMTLINDILDLSKIEAGKLELQYEYIDARAFFGEMKHFFSLRIEEKGLDFILDISSSSPDAIYIDETRLRQILINLLSNAIKFTEKGSVKLSVWAENPQIKEYEPGKIEEYLDLVIEVQDTGIGISKESRQGIFDAFRQQDEMITKKFGGTGLGLAITKELVEMMNGTISVTSEHNQGSKFRVVIPDVAFLRDFEEKGRELHINTENIIFRKATVLVVDNAEHNRKLISDNLRNTNLKTIEAENGEVALELVKKVMPDLVIADIRMPVMGGFELLERLKKDKRLKHVPVVAYSASAMKSQKERIMNGDFAGLLIKPVRTTDLFIELMNHLPHRVRDEDKEPEDPGEKMVPDEIEDLPGLLKELETGLMKTWEKFSSRQPVDEVKEFGGGNTGPGRKAQCPPA